MLYLSVMISKQWEIPSVLKNCNQILVCLTAIKTLNFWKTLTHANGVLPGIIWFQWMPNEANLVCPGLPIWFMQWHFSLNNPVNLFEDLTHFQSSKHETRISNVITWATSPGFTSCNIFSQELDYFRLNVDQQGGHHGRKITSVSDVLCIKSSL